MNPMDEDAPLRAAALMHAAARAIRADPSACESALDAIPDDALRALVRRPAVWPPDHIEAALNGRSPGGPMPRLDHRLIRFPALAWNLLAPFASWGTATWGVDRFGPPGALQTMAVRLALDELASNADELGADVLDRVRCAPEDVRERMSRGQAYNLTVCLDQLIQVLDADLKDQQADRPATVESPGGPMLRADAAFAAWLPRLATADEDFNAALRSYAGDVEAAAAERWRTFTAGSSDAEQLDMFPDPRVALWTLWVQVPEQPGWAEISAPKIVRNVARWVVRAAIPGWRDELVQIERAKRLQFLPLLVHDRLTSAARYPVVVHDHGAEIEGRIRWLPRPGVDVPADLLERWRGAGRATHSLAAWKVLDLVLRRIRELGPTTDHGSVPTTPRLLIPAGVKLAEELRLATNGVGVRAVNEAVMTWATATLDLGSVIDTVWHAAIVKAARGRPAGWIITPGEPLLPGYVFRLPERDRALVPWPDVLPPVDWIDTAQQSRALEAGMALPALWRRAVGRNPDGWLERPGVLLEPHWREIGAGVPMMPALEAWKAANWLVIDGDLVAPGPALPGVQQGLDEAADLIKGKADDARNDARRKRIVKRRLSDG